MSPTAIAHHAAITGAHTAILMRGNRAGNAGLIDLTKLTWAGVRVAAEPGHIGDGLGLAAPTRRRRVSSTTAFLVPRPVTFMNAAIGRVTGTNITGTIVWVGSIPHRSSEAGQCCRWVWARTWAGASIALQGVVHRTADIAQRQRCQIGRL